MFTCQRCDKDVQDLQLVRNVETGRRHWLCTSCRSAVRESDRSHEGPEQPNWQPAWKRQNAG